MHCLPGIVSEGLGLGLETQTRSQRDPKQAPVIQNGAEVPHSLAEPPTSWKNC